jgi:hypothetical protein
MNLQNIHISDIEDLDKKIDQLRDEMGALFNEKETLVVLFALTDQLVELGIATGTTNQVLIELVSAGLRNQYDEKSKSRYEERAIPANQ